MPPISMANTIGAVDSKRNVTSLFEQAFAPNKLPLAMKFPRASFSILILAVCIGVVPPCFPSALQQFSSRVWRTDDGLPQNAVFAIAQTLDGYLWIGTQKGLARFDGVHFTNFDRRNVPVFSHEWIDCLLAARDGTLWIGTRGGICRIQDGKFIHYGRDAGLPETRVAAVFQSRDGAIWFGLDHGLTCFKDGKFTRINGPDSFDRSVIRAIREDAGGKLWLATTTGLFWLGPGGGIHRFELPSQSLLRSVFVDRAGDLWVATARNGILRVHGGDISRFSKEEGLSDYNVNAVFEDRHHNLWAGSYGGLNRLDNGRFITEFTEENSPYDSVNTFFEDNEGNLWIGAKDGLYRLNPKRFSAYTTQHGLAHNNVMSVLEDSGGTLWFGTWGGGLHQLKNDRIEVYSSAKKTAGIALDLVLALRQARDGALWVGTDFDVGLFRFQEGNVRRFHSREHGIDSHAVKVIYEDHAGNIWVGTSGALNLLKDGIFTRFTTQNGLSGDAVRDLLEDAEGNLWIGTEGGLTRSRDGKFQTITERQGFGRITVADLYEDTERSLWIGTVGSGLYRRKNGKFEVFTTRDGLAEDTAHEILEDDCGNLWMSCRNGVYRVSKKELDDFARKKIQRVTCISYGRADGLPSTECNSVAKPAGCKTRDGRLWFATTKGLAVTDPAVDLKKNENPPPVVIEDVFADKKPLVTNDKWQVMKRDAYSVTMPPGRGELEFHYTALSFRAPEKNRFRYKLEGVDRDWVDAGTRRVAYYNNIAPGDYRFRVMGCNNDGVWNERGAAIALILQPHFWQTWWFQSAVVLTAAAALAMIYRLRQIRRREIEKLRLRIAADLHDEIGANLASIALLSQMSPTEKEAAELAEINRIALNTASSIREIVWFINPDYDTFAEMISKMRDVAATMLGGLQCEFKTPANPSTARLALDFRRNIFLVFKEILHNIVKHSQATKVQIEVNESGGEFVLRITDNGVGFDEKTIRRGNGLKNIRLRLAQLNGTAEIRGEPGKGTTICVFAKIT